MVLAVAVGAAACERGAGDRAADLGSADLSLAWDVDLLVADIAPPCAETNACGDCLPGCETFRLGQCYGAPLPLPADRTDPNVTAKGLARRPDGQLGFDPAYEPCYSPLWITNPRDWGLGTISDVRSRGLGERRRHPTVTCGSNADGSRAPCDGRRGCCAADDGPRYAARVAMKREPPRQAVQLAGNEPVRTAVDFDDSVFVLNRAPGGQPSLSKIAAHGWGCVDRNNDAAIATAWDRNGDGLIQTDCNEDGKPDDVASVMARPCLGGARQEYYGRDDECVLWTTNLGGPGDELRALALGPGALDVGSSDAWVGATANGSVFRVDGMNGRIKEHRRIDPRCRPHGAVVDSSGYAWTVPDGIGPLCVFDTRRAHAAVVRDPVGGPITGWGITIDREQSIWVSGGPSPRAWRYSPDRTAGAANLHQGTWLTLEKLGSNGGAAGAARGIAADSRSARAYFVWLLTAGGSLVRIPASDLMPPKMDSAYDASTLSVLDLGAVSPTGLGLDEQQNLAFTVPSLDAVWQVPIDSKGAWAAPAKKSLKDSPMSTPGSDAYGDLSAWYLGGFCRPIATYAYVVPGCKDNNGQPAATAWLMLDYRGDLPPNTRIEVRVREGPTPVPDNTWSAFSSALPGNPVELAAAATWHSAFLQIGWALGSSGMNATPTLDCFEVAYRCPP